MSTSAAIADSLLRRAFGWQARRSLPRRTVQVRLGDSRLRVPVSPRDYAISRRTVMNMRAKRIEKLQPHHPVEAFDCGQEALNGFLKKHALHNQRGGGSQTYVGLADETVIGYYALAVGSVEQDRAPERVKKGLAKHSIPIMLLARLAVDRRWQQQGIGAALLKDATLRTLQAADIVGIRALAVHAKSDAARKFYERFDFLPSPTDPLHLFMLLKDVRKLT